MVFYEVYTRLDHLGSADLIMILASSNFCWVSCYPLHPLFSMVWYASWPHSITSSTRCRPCSFWINSKVPDWPIMPWRSVRWVCRSPPLVPLLPVSDSLVRLAGSWEWLFHLFSARTVGRPTLQLVPAYCAPPRPNVRLLRCVVISVIFSLEKRKAWDGAVVPYWHRA